MILIYNQTEEPVHKTNRTGRVWERHTTACVWMHVGSVNIKCWTCMAHAAVCWSCASEAKLWCESYWDDLTCFLCHATPSFTSAVCFSQMSWSRLEFKLPPGVQAPRPRSCVISQDIPPRDFLAFVARPSSLSKTDFLPPCLRVCGHSRFPSSTNAAVLCQD